MKKTSILLSIAGAFLYLILSSYSSGPGSSGLELTGVTGPVGCGGSGTGCHSSTTASPGLMVTTTLETTTGWTVPAYSPGDTFVLHIHGFNASFYALPQFGYQATARLAWPVNAGMFIAPTGSHLDTVSGVRIVEHSAPLSGVGSGAYGTTYDVYIRWKAPAAGSGSVNFRSVLIAVNDTASGTTPFDMWNTGSGLVIGEIVFPMPIVAAHPEICEGSTTTLTDPTPGGTWISLTPSIATVGSSTGIVTGIAPGVATIEYTLTYAGTTANVTVDPVPTGITGPGYICTSSSALFTDSTPGGAWTSSDPGIATITSSGTVTAVSSGTSLISYTLSTGCYATDVINTGTMPPITGSNTACVGGTLVLSNIAAGGTWTSSDPSIASVSSGTVMAVTAGVATITYSTGSACAATKTITISATPSAAIAGTPTVCEGATTTLTGTPSGGTWVSMSAGMASVSMAGVVTGVSGGTTSLQYIASNSCGADTASTSLLVIPATICEMAVSGATSPQKSIAVYPNPSNGQCSITTSLAQTGVVSMRLINALGQVVSQWQMPANGMRQVQLPAIPGVYMLSADAEKLHFTEKIVVE